MEEDRKAEAAGLRAFLSSSWQNSALSEEGKTALYNLYLFKRSSHRRDIYTTLPHGGMGDNLPPEFNLLTNSTLRTTEEKGPLSWSDITRRLETWKGFCLLCGAELERKSLYAHRHSGACVNRSLIHGQQREYKKGATDFVCWPVRIREGTVECPTEEIYCEGPRPRNKDGTFPV